MYRVNVSRTFNTAHALTSYHGSDEPPHSHEWRCEVAIDSDSLDESGCAIDFVAVDNLLDEILRPFLNKPLNAADAFNRISPSAENIAKFIFNKASAVIDVNDTKVSSVTVWEDCGHSATYFKKVSDTFFGETIR